MIAILYLVFFVVYISISIWAIRKGYQFAKVKYQRGWVGALAAAFIMYNLVFWDLIPVVLMHKHYCETEAGFWEYKTPEQWVKEHPEAVGQDWGALGNWKSESLNKNLEPDKSYFHEIDRIWYGQHIFHENYHIRKNWLGISRTEEKIVDAKLGEVLAHSLNFQRGGSFYGGNYKFWLDIGNTSCSEAARRGVNAELEKLKQLVKGDKK